MASTKTDLKIIEDLQAYMDACTAVDQFSGAVLLQKNGRLLLRYAAGMADFELMVGNTPQTKFRLGSITKPITAMCIYILQEEQKISPDDPLNRYISDLPEALNQMRIHHLLAHKSGLANFTEFPDYAKTQRLPSTCWETINRFKNEALQFKIGEQCRYNNSAYIILGALIELLSGMTYADFVKSRIFEPLGMNDSGYDSHEILLPKRARGYIRNRQGMEPGPFLDMSIPFSAGALYSTIDDLWLFEQALREERPPFPRAVLQAMKAPLTGETYSCGWHQDTSDGRFKIGHSGGIDGFCTIFMRYPYDDLSIVVLSNVVSWAYSPERICQDLAAVVFGEAYQTPRNRTAIKLDSEKALEFIGVYAFEDQSNSSIIIYREGERWMAKFSPTEDYEIFPESEREFFINDFDAQISFPAVTQDQLTHLVLTHEGQSSRANKL
ncbi:MAG: beta-lactamase family protein [Candidatus Obscuribacterales bacterium]|nr:beta-lactamase family protein [Candidatus Obscuribacterales bacterium]